MKQKPTRRPNSPLAKIFYLAIAGFMAVQLFQTIIQYVRMTEYGHNQDSALAMVVSFLGFGIMLPIIVAGIIWATASKKYRNRQSLFDSFLIAIGMLTIVVGGGSLAGAFLPEYIGNYWMMSLAAPVVVACASVVIMLRRLRLKGEW